MFRLFFFFPKKKAVLTKPIQCFSMPDPSNRSNEWGALRKYLASLPSTLPRVPSAILVVSAHWQTPTPTLLRTRAPDLLFDYYGFPKHTYKPETFYADGRLPSASSDVADRVHALLTDAGLPVAEEKARGWDHGVFVPLSVMWNNDNSSNSNSDNDNESDKKQEQNENENGVNGGISPPIVQLSVGTAPLDAAAHLALGEALAPLRDSVLIVCSGMSFHNMATLGSPTVQGQAFDEALREKLQSESHAERCQATETWLAWPGARHAHPRDREEHLSPLFVALGAARDAQKVQFSPKFTALNWRFSGVRFD